MTESAPAAAATTALPSKAKRHASGAKAAATKAKGDFWKKYRDFDFMAFEAEDDKEKAAAMLEAIVKDPNFKNNQLRDIAVRAGFGRVSATALIYLRKRLYEEMLACARSQSALRHGTGRTTIKQRDVCKVDQAALGLVPAALVLFFSCLYR
jgi:hypothetical protein